jgi:hypothetical protein
MSRPSLKPACARSSGSGKVTGAYRAHATSVMKAMGIPDVVIDGVVEEADPPRKLVHTYRFIMAGMVASKFSEMGTGGWAWILSDMKSVLETGTSM